PSLSAALFERRSACLRQGYGAPGRPALQTLDVGRWTLNVLLPMRIDILTLFPEICRAPLSESMMKRAQENRIVDLRIHNLRDWTTDKHHVVDDAPFGGGQGMVMKPEPIFAAVEELRSQSEEKSKIEIRKSKIILLSPAGRRFD